MLNINLGWRPPVRYHGSSHFWPRNLKRARFKDFRNLQIWQRKSCHNSLYFEEKGLKCKLNFCCQKNHNLESRSKDHFLYPLPFSEAKEEGGRRKGGTLTMTIFLVIDIHEKSRSFKSIQLCTEDQAAFLLGRGGALRPPSNRIKG